MDMGQLLAALLTELLHQTDLLGLTLGNLIMITAGCILLYLGIVKKYEPMEFPLFHSHDVLQYGGFCLSLDHLLSLSLDS